MPERWDIVVVGAGAAGLMAAISAAEAGGRVLLLEKNRKPGVKILMSGGTRCNLTHATDNRGIVEAYGPPGRFLHSALASFSVQDTLDFFAAEGVATKTEETGKVFPVSNRAGDVLDALLRRVQRSGATLALGEPLRELELRPPGFVLDTPARTIEAGKVILTTGGQSYPGSGTTGDGYAFVARLGHTIVSPRPALTPITTQVPWVAELRGVTWPDTGVRLRQGSKVLADPSPARLSRSSLRRAGLGTPMTGDALLRSGRGSLLFAHFGLSGPVILDISREVSGHPEPRSLTLELDFLPGEKEPELDERLRIETAAQGKKQLAVLLAEFLPRRLCDAILTQSGFVIERKAAALSRPERTRLVASIKRLTVPVTGTLGFGKAEVTAGGVALSEVDSRTLASKRVANLYLAGELLDLDGPIGGYNFQAAWSTGWLAGKMAAQR